MPVHIKGSNPATYQDVLNAPPHLVAEIVRGALHTHPRPARQHARASSRLLGRLDGFDTGRGGPGGWEILGEPELHLGADVLVPDVAGWRRERLPGVAEDVAFFTAVPDWVCEVVSPMTRTYDLPEKRDIYAEHGVGFLQLPDPEARTLEAFSRDGLRWRLAGALHDDATVQLPPFEAVGWPLATLWWKET